MPSKPTIRRVCGACSVEFFAPLPRVRKGLAKFCSPQCNGKQTAVLKARPIMDRIWASVEKTATCWLWTAKKVDGKGYGQIVISGHQGKTAQVHRVVYEALVGPIPKGLLLDHLCRVHRCCRPDHLEPVTQSENQRRGLAARPSRLRLSGSPCPVCAGPVWIDARGIGGWNKAFCSPACQRESRRGAVRGYRRIGKRDGWICHVCRLPIDPSAPRPSDGCAVVDHVVPLALGGAKRDPGNVRIAHYRCNRAKGARP